MKCPKCQFENPNDIKFCGECGNKLERICPECNYPNPPQFKFCGECGHKFIDFSEPLPKELSFDEKLDKIQRYLPQGITEKILSQRGKIEGERKQVTVMFCDLEGFTSVVENLGSEKAYHMMDQIYEILIHKVHDYEGTVNEMTGDGVMALFGAPIALEDAPQRAIYAGMSIHREISIFNNKHKHHNMQPLKMRIGIHTGPVVVGTLGNDLRVEFKAVGDTVNLASRMESLAEPGSTNVSEDTFKLTEGLFRFESLGKRKVKGKKDQVNIYRVIARSSRRTRFDVSAEKGLTPFIGKKRELELLIDGFERSKDSRGRAFSITADAGVGKSRLLYEFRKVVTNEDITFLEGKCLSYGRTLAYHPIIDILKSTFNIEDDDSDQEIRRKVIKSLRNIGLNEPDTLPYFLELLSVSDSGIENIAMSPEGKKAQIIETLKQFVFKGSESRPLVMVVEDLHWIDTSSEDVLNELLPGIPAAKILLIFTYRTEYLPPWKGKSYHNQVTLNRFSNSESLKMLHHLLGMDDLPIDFEELILQKTEGIPFYIEEVIKSLDELNVRDQKEFSKIAEGEHSVCIPSTIQDVIMSRVDRLPEKAKEILHFGAVIGREYSNELLQNAMTITEQELLSSMSVLIDSEILYERGIFPDSTYVFKHALTQEVIYDSLLIKRKKLLHEKIGNTIEEIKRENISEYYGILSEHFMKSETYEKSIYYSKMASKAAQKRSAYKDAISYAKKSIYCLENMPQTDEVRRRVIDARTTLAILAIALNYHIEANNAVIPVIDLAKQIDYKKRLPRIYVATGTYRLWHEENFPQAIAELQKAITLSEQTGDFVSLWTACYHLGVALSIECDHVIAYQYLSKALELSLAANSVLGTTMVRCTLASWNYAFQGKTDIAVEIGREGLQLVKDSGDLLIMGFALSLYGSACYHNGLFEEAEQCMLESIVLCEKTSHFTSGAWAALCLGSLYSENGDFKNALKIYAKASLFIEQGDIFPSLHGLSKICAVNTEIKMNKLEIDQKELLNYSHRNKFKNIDGWISRVISEILFILNVQDQNKAEDWIKKAIDVDGKRGLKWQLAMDFAVYSDFYKKKGNYVEAKEMLGKAIDHFKACNSDGWVYRMKQRLVLIR